MLTLDALDDLPPATQTVAPTAEIPQEPVDTRPHRPVRKGVLYFDLETAPDYDRRSTFGLPDVPPPAVRRPFENPEKNATDLIANKIEIISGMLKELNPDDAFLDLLETIERKSPKPRKGVLDLISEIRNQDNERNALVAAQIKTMSVTPEMCRIIAFGWSFDGNPASSMVVGVDGVTEVDILKHFWTLAKSLKQVCGFNILGFDLPVIFVRSMLLDVTPRRQFNMKPWGNDVVDLMAKRWPKGPATGLKKLCAMLGIPIPAEGVDGSQAEGLLRTDPLKLAQYVRSDVHLVEAVHQLYCGFFC